MLFGLNEMPGLFAVELGELMPVLAKVFNLLLFAGVMYFVLRRPLAEAFRARQEGIRRDLMRAEEEARAIREQARREIESASKTARAELRAYAAEQSVRMAEEMIRREIRPEDDAHLVKEYVGELGG